MKTLLITGASSGIGLATANRYLADGFQVINLSRRDCPEAAVTHITTDLSEPSFLSKIESKLNDALNAATSIVLIHNASKLTNDSVGGTDSADLRQINEINLIAPNTLNNYCIPLMKPNSAILYVGSTLSEKAVPGSFSYVTSKHATVGMMRATCQDLAGQSIHTACICPGFTDTEMLRDHVPAESMDFVAGMSAYKRLITPEEIAETLWWCGNNPVINGSVVHANLGQVES